MRHFYDLIKTPLGNLHCVIEDEQIILLHFQKPEKPNQCIHPLFQECQNQINAYFRGQLDHFSLPIKLQGGIFTQKIFRTLLRVPYGKTITYQELASLSGFPKAQRAVGTTLARNPLLLLLPCHRVIQSDGSYGQFAWKQTRKKQLLELEFSQVQNTFTQHTPASK